MVPPSSEYCRIVYSFYTGIRVLPQVSWSLELTAVNVVGVIDTAVFPTV